MLAETGNYTRASEELHISQPALSKNIKHLEAEIDCELLERHNSGCFLTPYGKLVYTHAKIIHNEMELLKSELRQMKLNQEQHLRIGWGLLWQIKYASDILLEVEKDSDNSIVFTGENGITGLMQEKLLRGGCDIFLGRIPNEKSSKLVYTPLLRTYHMIFGHEGHPLHEKIRKGKTVSIEDLSRFSWLVLGAKSDLTGYEIPLDLRERIEVQTIHDVNGLMIILQILQQSDYLVLLPGHVEEELRSYRIYALQSTELKCEDFDSGLIYRKEMETNPYLQIVIRAIKRVVERKENPA